jgi:hypothetical protein
VQNRLIAAFLTACLLAPSAAFAGYYSNTKCDGPKFEPYILSKLGTGTLLRNNQAAGDHVRFGPVLQSTLVSNTGDSLTCEITVQYGIKQVHGRVTSTKTPKGFAWKWLPNY